MKVQISYVNTLIYHLKLYRLHLNDQQDLKELNKLNESKQLDHHHQPTKVDKNIVVVVAMTNKVTLVLEHLDQNFVVVMVEAVDLTIEIVLVLRAVLINNKQMILLSSVFLFL